MVTLKSIKSIKDVELFTAQLVAEGLSFHPDTDFQEYVTIETNEKSYTKEEARHRNELTEQCFEICEKENADIYDICNEILLKETGLDEFIPLPSQLSQ